jgi:hypothetical protein
MLALLFDSAGPGGSGSCGTGRRRAAASERVAQTAAVILAHFAESPTLSAAMVRAGALADLKRALKVGPGGICIFFCPSSLCFIPQIRPIMLELCPIIPKYAD